MKKHLLVILLTICVINLKSQNIIKSYYQIMNKADSFNYISKDKSKALELYLKANDLCEKNNIFISSTEDGLKVIRMLATKGNNEAIAKMFLLMIKNGLNKKEYLYHKENDSTLIFFLKSKYSNYIDLNYDSLYRLHLPNRDINFDLKIISLFSQDVYSRKVLSINNISELFTIDTIAKLKSLIFNYSDCEIRKEIISVLRDKKFLDFENNYYGLSILRFLLLHNLYIRELTKINPSCSYIEFYNIVEPILKDLVIKGKIKNLDYAFLIDRATCWGSNEYCEQIYGTHLNKDKQSLLYPIYDIKNVDKRRAEIFLPSLYQASIIEGFKLPKEYLY